MASVAFTLLTALAGRASAKTVKTPTPQMGWNSYNYYNCYPNETIIKENAHAVVDTGLAEAGYATITTDCGWPAKERDANGELVWNPDLFPSGGAKELGDYLHNLGLRFGVYSGGGYFQCGSTDQPASLDHELTDAKSFAAWGADILKYDNCYPIDPTVMVDYVSEEAISPDRFVTMAEAMNTTDRDMVYQVCQWGTGTDLGVWVPKIGNSWRISNDIYNSWRSIWRITNQVVPFYKYTGPGAFPDMDMLIVGLNALSIEEERFHMGMWSINKSPLTLGAPAIPALVPEHTLSIVANKEVIAINQDPLAKQAQLVRRFTEEEWDVWAGELSGDRLVVGIANWKNDSRAVAFDVADVLGLASANARDVWAASDVGSISGTYETTLEGHELRLLVLSDLARAEQVHTPAGYYTAATNGTLSGSAAAVACGSSSGGGCLPSGTKVGNIGSGAAVKFEGVEAKSEGKKLLGVDFINYDVALDTAWGYGANVRNMTVAVNGGTAKRWAFPISGGNWYDTGRLLVEVEGFKGDGSNTVEFKNVGSDWAPDLVGFEVFESA